MIDVLGIKTELILIHTSVKLVTLPLRRKRRDCDHFNPHEREARDRLRSRKTRRRRGILIHTSVKLVTVHKFYTLVSIYFSIQNANVVDLH